MPSARGNAARIVDLTRNGRVAAKVAARPPVAAVMPRTGPGPSPLDRFGRFEVAPGLPGTPRLKPAAHLRTAIGASSPTIRVQAALSTPYVQEPVAPSAAPALGERVLLAGGTPQFGVTTISGPDAPPAQVDDWRLLPRSAWSDEFSPLYVNPDGLYCEGDPRDDDDTPTLLRYTLRHPPTGRCQTFEAVANEAFVEFQPDTHPDAIRRLFCTLGLSICGAWYDPKPRGQAGSMSWFHVEILRSSPFYDDIPGLLDYLSSRSDVGACGYNDVAKVCGRALFDPESGDTPDDAVFQSRRPGWTGDSEWKAPASVDASAYWNVQLGPKNLADANQAEGLGAWYSADADLGDEDKLPICVAIMDTGIDVDHPNFGLKTRGDNVNRGQVFNQGGIRQGITAAKRNVKDPEIGVLRRELGGQPRVSETRLDLPWPAFRDIARAPSSPQLRVIPTDDKAGPGLAGRKVNIDEKDPDPRDPEDTGKEKGKRVKPDPLKFIDLRYRGHAHGTAMAGIVGAIGSDAKGVTGFGARYVKVMSATMRMVGNDRVDTASAVKCVKALQNDFGIESVGVVLMGFVQNAVARDVTDWVQSPKSRRSKRKQRLLMSSLLEAMRADVAAGNDRLWIAPAGYGRGEDLSYPAAILWPAVGPENKPTILGSDPEVLGVTGVIWDETTVKPFPGTNFFSPGGVPDLDVYGVSAAAEGAPTIDVRDAWYGDRWGYDSNREYRDFKKTYNPSDLRGYAGQLSIADETDKLNRQAGYAKRNSDDAEAVQSGNYYGKPDTRSLPGNVFIGNSVAAAQIAALAGAIRAKFPNRTAFEVAQHIRESVQGEAPDGSPNGVTCLVKGQPGACSITTPASERIYFVPSGGGAVPAPVSFLIALNTEPDKRERVPSVSQ